MAAWADHLHHFRRVFFFPPLRKKIDCYSSELTLNVELLLGDCTLSDTASGRDAIWNRDGRGCWLYSSKFSLGGLKPREMCFGQHTIRCYTYFLLVLRLRRGSFHLIFRHLSPLVSALCKRSRSFPFWSAMFTSRFQHLSEVVDKCRVAVAIALRVVQPQGLDPFELWRRETKLPLRCSSWTVSKYWKMALTPIHAAAHSLKTKLQFRYVRCIVHSKLTGLLSWPGYPFFSS